MPCDTIKLQKRWFYLTKNNKVVGPMKVKGLLYGSSSHQQREHLWTIDGKHLKDGDLDIIKGFDCYQAAAKAYQERRQSNEETRLADIAVQQWKAQEVSNALQIERP